MTIKLIHLSDIHLKKNWEEEQGVVFKEFFSDLASQIGTTEKCFIVVSGDVVHAGSTSDQYSYFSELFLSEFKKIGIDKDRFIVAPGDVVCVHGRHFVAIAKGFDQGARGGGCGHRGLLKI